MTTPTSSCSTNGCRAGIYGLWTVARPGWVLTPAGLAAFALWNVLLAVMAVLALMTFRRRLRGPLTTDSVVTHPVV